MKIRDILQEDRIKISFEVFPPKAGGSFDSVKACTRRIAGLRPDFCSVTYGAQGGASENTVAITDFVQNQLGVSALAHLTCVSSSKDDIREKCRELQAAGIENILALRGDIPPQSAFEPSTDFAHASDLMEAIHDLGDFCMGGACYPEGHVESEDKYQDIHTLKRKQEAGASFLTTQMFFDNNIFYNFMYRLRDAGVSIPVIPGIMPLTGIRQIKQIKQLSGSNLPASLLAITDAFHDQPAAMKQAGIIYATNQIIDLIANGIKAIHIYTMNKAEIAESIMANLEPILARKQNESA